MPASSPARKRPLWSPPQQRPMECPDPGEDSLGRGAHDWHCCPRDWTGPGRPSHPAATEHTRVSWPGAATGSQGQDLSVVMAYHRHLDPKSKSPFWENGKSGGLAGHGGAGAQEPAVCNQKHPWRLRLVPWRNLVRSPPASLQVRGGLAGGGGARCWAGPRRPGPGSPPLDGATRWPRLAALLPLLSTTLPPQPQAPGPGD